MEAGSVGSSARLPVALTIAGSDSGGGAGLQADLKTFAAFGAFGASVVTCVTAQNTREVRRVDALSDGVIRAQMDAVFADLPIAAAKTGLLCSDDVVRAVASYFGRAGAPPLVVDPVLVATSGDRLADPGVAGALLDSLVPVATVVTPNLFEASVLAGRPVASLADMRAAASVLVDRGARAVLVKGGHLADAAVDVLLDDAGYEELAAARVAGPPVHGTGCALSAAIAAGLAHGRPLREAVAAAKHFVRAAIEGAVAVGGGARVLDLRPRSSF